MRPARAKYATLALLCLSLACGVPELFANKKDRDKRGQAASGASDRRRVLHTLNRLTFGPRPGDVQQVMSMGVERWLDLQLHPETIDDSEVNARLAPLVTLRMSQKAIADAFPDPQEIRQVMNGKRSMPSDPAQRAIYQVQIARLQSREERKKEAGKDVNAAQEATSTNSDNQIRNSPQADRMSAEEAPPNFSSDDIEKPLAIAANEPPFAAPDKQAIEEQNRPRREEELQTEVVAQQLQSLPPYQRYNEVLRMATPEQLAFADSLRGGKAQDLLEGMEPRQKATLLAMNNRLGGIPSELAQAKLLRAVYSQRQLLEVMTDFWINHFNVFVDKGLDRLLLTSYERDAIRPRALGKFEDLLVATAKSPAMLFYLDNWLSVGPNSQRATGRPLDSRRQRGRRDSSQLSPTGNRRNSLNENYGRELMELHTLSLNAGYSQRDVTEVAKVFTGWTIDKPSQGGSFKFEPRMHEPGPKFVLGHRIKPKGENEGLEVLHRLATSPYTAHFISLKLAERFVSDDPPAALVDRMAKTFLKKKGDIREVLSTLFHSPEFWDDGAYRAKMKTPLEFVASAVRATGAEVDNALPLTRRLNNMGMPLYGAQPPTGYSMKAETWVSSSALLNRMNFALALTSGKIKGVRVNPAEMGGSKTELTNGSLVLSSLEASLVVGDVSRQTHDSIAAQLDMPVRTALRSADVAMIAGLLLGSPEFQRR